jgi:hypothetical protein
MWDAIETRAPVEKSRSGATQECCLQLDVAVPAWPAANPFLPSTPHPSATSLDRLEK